MRNSRELPISALISKYDFLLFGAFSLLAFGRCVLGGLAYFDNDLLAQFGPWRAFLKDQLTQGHFPLWNPYLLGGQPFFADLQNMMLYPFNWLTLSFSIPYGLSMFFLIHMFWAALGMHLWLRLLGLSSPASRTGALLFSLSNFFWLELIHPPVIAAFAWLPWLFAGLENLSQSLRPRHAFYSGFAFAMLFLCGSIQVTIGAFYGALVYFIFRIWYFARSREAEVLAKPLKTFLMVGFLLIWGSLPLLAQFIPTFEFSSLCERGAPNQTYEQSNSKLPLNPSTIYQFLFPRFTLPPGKTMAEAIQFGNTDNDTHFAANLGYLGVWVPLLVVAAFRSRERNIIWFLFLFLLASLAVCFGRYLPVHRFACAVLPGFSIIRVPYRFLYLYVLAASAMAAFGLDTLLHAESNTRLKNLLFFSVLLYFAALFKPHQNWREIIGLVIGVLAAFLWGTQNRWKNIGSIFFQASLMIPLLLNGWSNFIPGPASNFNFAENSKPLAEEVERLKPYRVVFFNTEMYYPIQISGKHLIVNYPQNDSCALKIKNYGGYNPLMLQTKRDILSLSLESMIQVGAISGILAQPGHPIPGFTQKNFSNFCLYESRRPLSYIFVPEHLQVMKDPLRRIALMENPDFDPTKLVVLSEPATFENFEAYKPGSPIRFRWQLLRDDPDAQRFSVELSRENIAVFSETMFPGWKAYVDGQSAPLLTADHSLRAVFLKAGRHLVDFRFEPRWWRPIQTGLFLWLAVTFLGFFISVRYQKRLSNA